MSRHGWLAVTEAALVLAACGCISNSSTIADAAPVPASPAAADPAVSRAQKPEERSPAQRGNDRSAVCRLINLPVDRPAEAAHADRAATIRAVVNGDLILEEEVLLSCQMNLPLAQQLFGARTPEEREAVLKEATEDLIERELLLQDAIGKLKRGGKQGEALLKKIEESADQEFEKSMLRPILKEKHLGSRAELVAYLRERRMSLDVMRRWWERKWMAQQYLGARLEHYLNGIGHLEVTDYYNNHRDEYMQSDSVDWQDIFVDAGRHASPAAAREFAQSLVQRVRERQDFATLSREYDNGESRFRKGAGQGHKRGEIFPPEAEPHLFQMNEGDTEIVECAHGFHVIHVLKRQHAGPIPFDAKVQKEIHDKIRNQVFLREKESIVKELKRKAVIDRCD
ncbi:MAG TPA: peptidyl-prolyl cis-trans isomerase [Gemmataceae bacterium]|jgi:parvulin-like peptidyl-prolyl isomerase